VDRLYRGGLVKIRSREASTGKTGHDPSVEPRWERAMDRRLSGQDFVVKHPPGERRFGKQGRENIIGCGGSVGAHRSLNTERVC
jgi:hypothetical protein